jgi:multicomponent Na+:H+ antiporter subunit B
VGMATVLLGGAYLDYDMLNPADPPAGQTLGIILVEIGVGITVSAVMITLFNELARAVRR